MIKSEELEVRESSIRKIMSIRSRKPAKNRLKKITSINTNANHWSELISLSQPGIFEPALTENFSDQEFQEALNNGTKLFLPDLPSHSQSVERAVELTSEASHAVYGLESRHKHILAKCHSRQMRPSFASKGSYSANYEEFGI